MSLWDFFAGPSEPVSRDPFDDFWYFPIRSTSASGIDVDEDVAMTCSTAWAATRLLCVGSILPLNVHRSRKGGGADVATDHPVQFLLHNQPNDEMGTTMWRASRTAQQINGGNGYSEILRDGRGTPQGLVPIHCCRVDPMRETSNGNLFYRVKNDDATTTDIARENMLHVTSIMSDNGITGKGVVTHARETIGFSIATERQGAAYMRNSARPSYAIIGGTFKDDAAREYYRKTWVAHHGGPDNNAKPAMLPHGSTLTPLGFSQEDSQFILTRQHNVEEVNRWYGTPPHMTQHLLRATYSNIEQQSIDFVVYSLLPWLKLWEDACNMKLLTRSEIRQGYFIKHNVEGLLRGDRQARALFYEALWRMGALSINEIRDKEDMNPIGPDGDKRFVQTSYATIDKTSMSEWKAARDKNDVSRDEFRSNVLGLSASKVKEDAPLLSLVGGLTGTTDVSSAVGRGEMKQDAASELIQMFFNIDKEKADKIAGERMERFDEAPPPAQNRSDDNDKPDAFNPMLDRLASLEQHTRSEFESLRTALSQAPLNGKSSQAVECASRLLRSTIGRMLNKEARAAEAAAKNNKTFSDFVAWMDGYYSEYRETFVEVVSGYVEMALLAKHDERDPRVVATSLADQHIAVSRESILQATEVQPDQWCEVPNRIHESAEQWQQTRTEVAL